MTWTDGPRAAAAPPIPQCHSITLTAIVFGLSANFIFFQNQAMFGVGSGRKLKTEPGQDSDECQEWQPGDGIEVVGLDAIEEGNA